MCCILTAGQAKIENASHSGRIAGKARRAEGALDFVSYWGRRRDPDTKLYPAERQKKRSLLAEGTQTY
jgi:hypothetical protein